MEYGVNKSTVKIAIRFHILVFCDVVGIKLTQTKNVLKYVSQIDRGHFVISSCLMLWSFGSKILFSTNRFWYSVVKSFWCSSVDSLIGSCISTAVNARATNSTFRPLVTKPRTCRKSTSWLLHIPKKSSYEHAMLIGRMFEGSFNNYATQYSYLNLQD